MTLAQCRLFHWYTKLQYFVHSRTVLRRRGRHRYVHKLLNVLELQGLNHFDHVPLRQCRQFSSLFESFSGLVPRLYVFVSFIGYVFTTVKSLSHHKRSQSQLTKWLPVDKYDWQVTGSRFGKAYYCLKTTRRNNVCRRWHKKEIWFWWTIYFPFRVAGLCSVAYWTFSFQSYLLYKM